MNESEFWLRIWKFILIGVVTIVLCITSCNMHIDYRIGKAIDNGADPLESRLAFEANSEFSQMSVALLRQKECKKTTDE